MDHNVPAVDRCLRRSRKASNQADVSFFGGPRRKWPSGPSTLNPPLLKTAGCLDDLNNYRAITISPVISKLFELILLKVCNCYLSSDELQFGFKSGLGCSEAIFTLRSTIDYFNANGSTVYVAALDISKAYDKVNHYKLFSSLISAGLPKWFIDLLLLSLIHI